MRLLLFLFVLALPAGLWAQDAGTDTTGPIIVSGIVQEQGVAYEPLGEIEGFRQSVSLIAWRQNGEAISPRLLRLRINVDTLEQQQALQAPFRKGRLVSFVIKSPVTFHRNDGAILHAKADFAEMAAPVIDPEIRETAGRILNPEAFVDQDLGEFLPHSRLFDHFGQIREWLGKETIFEVILNPMGPDAREQALSMAQIAWTDHAAIDETIRETVTDRMYSRRAQDAGVQLVPVDGSAVPVTIDEFPPLSREDFKRNHVLGRVSCSAQDYCALQYNATGIEWYWSYQATIRRKGEGWYLDEWDFP